MREIKFRFWSGKKMFYEPHFEQVYECLKQQREFACDKHTGYDHIGIHGAAFLQFTGLKDKNGKEIFEGDVVSIFNVEEKKLWDENHEVVFAFGSFGIKAFIHFAAFDFEIYEMTVIGNIYENENLLSK